jgi:hypothetical protein
MLGLRATERILFGVGKLLQVAGAIGKGVRNFKDVPGTILILSSLYPPFRVIQNF